MHATSSLLLPAYAQSSRIKAAKQATALDPWQCSLSHPSAVPHKQLSMPGLPASPPTGSVVLPNTILFLVLTALFVRIVLKLACSCVLWPSCFSSCFLHLHYGRACCKQAAPIHHLACTVASSNTALCACRHVAEIGLDGIVQEDPEARKQRVSVRATHPVLILPWLCAGMW